MGSNPAEAVKIFQGEKILSMPSFGGEVKLSVPCLRVAACKRSLNETWKYTFRQNYQLTFSHTVPPFAAKISRVVWTWRHLVAEVGTSKKITGGQGSHSKPIGCCASGTYAPGPDDEDEGCSNHQAATWRFLTHMSVSAVLSAVYQGQWLYV
jgi:hypothetical protein